MRRLVVANDRLLATLRALVGRERDLLAELLAHLAELDVASRIEDASFETAEPTPELCACPRAPRPLPTPIADENANQTLRPHEGDGFRSER